MGRRPPVRWGVAGTGDIANTFADDVELAPSAALHAVGSRRADSARAFQERHRIPTAHASYQALVDDPEVDAVYVAVPHPWHVEVAECALLAGKAVLCEKPFTMDAREAERLISLARDRGVFLMEAMWVRFLPHMRKAHEIVDSGVLGRLVQLQADHSGVFPYDPDSLSTDRMYSPELGGGALLDLGVYCVSLAVDFLGAPESVRALSTMTESAVDATTSMILGHSSGAQAQLSCSLDSAGHNFAQIVGTRGRLVLDATWYGPTTLTLETGPKETFRFDVDRYGMHLEIEEASRCITLGLVESPLMPHDDSRAVMAVLDEVREQIGLTYPARAAPG